MAITHILRGDEWLSSVPLHVNLYSALGWEIPAFAHLPLILDPSGEGKLSKRKKKGEGDEELLTYVREYREAGYLPEAMFNFLANMGWAYSPDTDLFTREQAVAQFDIMDINPAAGALPLSKLQWMNGHYIRELDPEELLDRVLPFLSRASGLPEAELARHPAFPRIAPLIQERLKTLDEAWNWVDFVFVDAISYDPALLIPKGLDATRTLEALQAARGLVAESPFTMEALEGALDPALRGLAERLGLKPGHVFGILRTATTGKSVAPPLFGSFMALGQERVLERCLQAEAALRTGLGS
jgi:glutamyl-tRNA synthetase